MESALQACRPRGEIVKGTFNPEIFTAALGPIIEHYRGGTANLDALYTDPGLFFGKATYPTQGLRSIVGEVFGRIAGDGSVPAIHRLETAFGGGKTHALISCTHIAFKGKELADAVDGLLAPGLLPDPGSVSVVGVAGEDIAVHKPLGAELVPYTLWGEIAYQVGGEPLYRSVEADATSFAAPGKGYFHKVFGGRKVLVMLDELAQYAARLEAARTDGASQLAAFLMALHGYARSNPGISVVLTLAGASDAFAKQTRQLAELVGKVRGEDVSEDDALGIGERAVKDVASVVARDSTPVTPVQASEISSVLAKRLFDRIDRSAAEETTAAYAQMYQRNASLLPDRATRADYKDRMAAHYPFHPTLIDFLNAKLAVAENFQGTRGVLRVLSLAVRQLWQKGDFVPMVHACHLDLRNDRTVSEIFGKTGSSDLLPALNVDVGGVDTGQIESGYSNAELADQRNPHPEGHPLYEFTWKTVFLHSLVDRDAGLESNLFGLAEQEALFAASFPGLTPPQVQTALHSIAETAFFLHVESGRYYASDVPTVNSILARIRSTVSEDAVRDLLSETARKVVSGGAGPFHVRPDVYTPEDIPDKKSIPALALVALDAEAVEVDAFFTTKGQNLPREQQNAVLLLVPDTATVKGVRAQADLLTKDRDRAQEARSRIEFVARQVQAIRTLAKKPQSYGIDPRHLEADDFKRRKAEREKALGTVVAQAYSSLYYPSVSGQILRQDIRNAGVEGGASFVQVIRDALLARGEIVVAERSQRSDLMNLAKLFFAEADTIALAKIREDFFCLRKWPMLESPSVLDPLIRAGVERNVWCMFRMGGDENTKPAEFYSQETGVPLGADLGAEGFAIVSVQGANQRGWTLSDKPDPAKVRECVKEAVAEGHATTVCLVKEAVAQKLGDVPEKDVKDAVADLVKKGRISAFHGTPAQKEKPAQVLSGGSATLYEPQMDDALITNAEAAERGWVAPPERGLSLSGKEGAKVLVPLLRRIGSLYGRGGASTVDNLDISDLELPHGGTLTLRVENAPPESMALLGELFEVLHGAAEAGERTEAWIEIKSPKDGCAFVKELKPGEPG